MARFQVFGVVRDTAGNVLPSASVSVYEAGTTTPVTVYDAYTGGNSYSSAPQITADANGEFEFWIDDGDYTPADLFKIVVTSGSYSSSRDYFSVVHVLSTSQFTPDGTEATIFTVGSESDEDTTCEFRADGSTTGGYDPPALVWNGTTHKWEFRDHENNVTQMGRDVRSIFVGGVLAVKNDIVRILGSYSGTVTKIGGIIESGTSCTFRLTNNGNTMATVTATPSGVSTDSISNASFSEFSKIELDITAVSGNPEELTVYLHLEG